MAEDKKSKGWDFNFIEAAILLLFLAGITTAILPAISRFISSGELSFFGYPLGGISRFFKSHTFFFKILGYTVAVAAAVGTIIFNKKGDEIWRQEKARLYPMGTGKPSYDSGSVKDPIALKWESIVNNSESNDPSLWRLCIIEADIILEDLLRQLKLPGDTIGERLKVVEKSDFNTIEYAWEAHKARNMIAHEGDNFLLNQRETRRIISLYEAVFKEFHII